MKLNQIKEQAKTYGIQRLSLETQISRSHLYGILNGTIEPKLSTLEKLLQPLGYELKLQSSPAANINPNYIRWSLAYYEAPLIIDESFETPPSREDTLLQALILGRQLADINATLPNFIYKNHQDISWDKIINENTEPHYLAYLMNLITHITNHKESKNTLKRLKKDLHPLYQPERLIQRGPISRFEKMKLESTNNTIADSWKFQTTDHLKDIERRFNKWNTINP